MWPGLVRAQQEESQGDLNVHFRKQTVATREILPPITSAQREEAHPKKVEPRPDWNVKEENSDRTRYGAWYLPVCVPGKGLMCYGIYLVAA